MERALINCPTEKFFLRNLLVSRPALPTKKNKKEELTSIIEVEVLGVFGEKALIRLPNILANKEEDTALISVQYLD